MIAQGLPVIAARVQAMGAFTVELHSHVLVHAIIVEADVDPPHIPRMLTASLFRRDMELAHVSQPAYDLSAHGYTLNMTTCDMLSTWSDTEVELRVVFDSPVHTSFKISVTGIALDCCNLYSLSKQVYPILTCANYLQGDFLSVIENPSQPPLYCMLYAAGYALLYVRKYLSACSYFDSLALLQIRWLKTRIGDIQAVDESTMNLIQATLTCITPVYYLDSTSKSFDASCAIIRSLLFFFDCMLYILTNFPIDLPDNGTRFLKIRALRETVADTNRILSSMDYNSQQSIKLSSVVGAFKRVLLVLFSLSTRSTTDRMFTQLLAMLDACHPDTLAHPEKIPMDITLFQMNLFTCTHLLDTYERKTSVLYIIDNFMEGIGPCVGIKFICSLADELLNYIFYSQAGEAPIGRKSMDNAIHRLLASIKQCIPGFDFASQLFALARIALMSAKFLPQFPSLLLNDLLSTLIVGFLKRDSLAIDNLPTPSAHISSRQVLDSLASFILLLLRYLSKSVGEGLLQDCARQSLTDSGSADTVEHVSSCTDVLMKASLLMGRIFGENVQTECYQVAPDAMDRCIERYISELGILGGFLQGSNAGLMPAHHEWQSGFPSARRSSLESRQCTFRIQESKYRCMATIFSNCSLKFYETPNIACTALHSLANFHLGLYYPESQRSLSAPSSNKYISQHLAHLLHTAYNTLFVTSVYQAQVFVFPTAPLDNSSLPCAIENLAPIPPRALFDLSNVAHRFLLSVGNLTQALMPSGYAIGNRFTLVSFLSFVLQANVFIQCNSVTEHLAHQFILVLQEFVANIPGFSNHEADNSSFEGNDPKSLPALLYCLLSDEALPFSEDQYGYALLNVLSTTLAVISSRLRYNMFPSTFLLLRYILQTMIALEESLHAYSDTVTIQEGAELSSSFTGFPCDPLVKLAVTLTDSALNLSLSSFDDTMETIYSNIYCLLARHSLLADFFMQLLSERHDATFLFNLDFISALLRKVSESLVSMPDTVRDAFLTSIVPCIMQFVAENTRSMKLSTVLNGSNQIFVADIVSSSFEFLYHLSKVTPGMIQTPPLTTLLCAFDCVFDHLFDCSCTVACYVLLKRFSHASLRNCVTVSTRPIDSLISSADTTELLRLHERMVHYCSLLSDEAMTDETLGTCISELIEAKVLFRWDYDAVYGKSLGICDAIDSSDDNPSRGEQPFRDVYTRILAVIKQFSTASDLEAIRWLGEQLFGSNSIEDSALPVASFSEQLKQSVSRSTLLISRVFTSSTIADELLSGHEPIRVALFNACQAVIEKVSDYSVCSAPSEAPQQESSFPMYIQPQNPFIDGVGSILDLCVSSDECMRVYGLVHPCIIDTSIVFSPLSEQNFGSSSVLNTAVPFTFVLPYAYAKPIDVSPFTEIGTMAVPCINEDPTRVCVDALETQRSDTDPLGVFLCGDLQLSEAATLDSLVPQTIRQTLPDMSQVLLYSVPITNPCISMTDALSRNPQLTSGVFLVPSETGSVITYTVSGLDVLARNVKTRMMQQASDDLAQVLQDDVTPQMTHSAVAHSSAQGIEEQESSGKNIDCFDDDVIERYLDTNDMPLSNSPATAPIGQYVPASGAKGSDRERLLWHAKSDEVRLYGKKRPDSDRSRASLHICRNLNQVTPARSLMRYYNIDLRVLRPRSALVLHKGAPVEDKAALPAIALLLENDEECAPTKPRACIADPAFDNATTQSVDIHPHNQCVDADDSSAKHVRRPYSDTAIALTHVQRTKNDTISEIVSHFCPHLTEGENASLGDRLPDASCISIVRKTAESQSSIPSDVPSIVRADLAYMGLPEAVQDAAYDAYSTPQTRVASQCVDDGLIFQPASDVTEPAEVAPASLPDAALLDGQLACRSQDSRNIQKGTLPSVALDDSLDDLFRPMDEHNEQPAQDNDDSDEDAIIEAFLRKKHQDSAAKSSSILKDDDFGDDWAIIPEHQEQRRQRPAAARPGKRYAAQVPIVDASPVECETSWNPYRVAPASDDSYLLGPGVSGHNATSRHTAASQLAVECDSKSDSYARLSDTSTNTSEDKGGMPLSVFVGGADAHGQDFASLVSELDLDLDIASAAIQASAHNNASDECLTIHVRRRPQSCESPSTKLLSERSMRSPLQRAEQPHTTAENSRRFMTKDAKIKRETEILLEELNDLAQEEAGYENIDDLEDNSFEAPPHDASPTGCNSTLSVSSRRESVQHLDDGSMPTKRKDLSKENDSLSAEFSGEEDEYEPV